MPYKYEQPPAHVPDVEQLDLEASRGLNVQAEPELADDSLQIDARIMELETLTDAGADEHSDNGTEKPYDWARIADVIMGGATGAPMAHRYNGPRLSDTGHALVASLWDKYSESLYRYLHRATSGDWSIAEDLRSQTFEKITRSLCIDVTSFPTDTKAQTRYIFRVAHNTLVDYIRRRNLPYADSVSLEGIAEIRGDRFAGKDEIERATTYMAVMETLQKLPPNYRSTLVLHEAYGYSCQEVADIVRCSPSAIKMRLMRARERFLLIYSGKLGEAIRAPKKKQLRLVPRAANVAYETPDIDDAALA